MEVTDKFVDTVNLGHQAFLNKLKSTKTSESNFSYWLTSAALNLCMTRDIVKLKGRLEHIDDLVKEVENGFNQMKDVLHNLSQEDQDHVKYCQARFNHICCGKSNTSTSDEVHNEFLSTGDTPRPIRPTTISKDIESRQILSAEYSRQTVSRNAGFPKGQYVGRRRLQQQFSDRKSRLDRPAAELFISAIRSLDIDTVEKFLKSDLQIEYGYLNNSDRSILHIVVELIETGTISGYSLKHAGINEKAEKRLDPLRRSEDLRRIVKVLLESGKFNVNTLTNSSESVFHIAARNCHCNDGLWLGNNVVDYKDLVNSIIELLLNNNANINAINSSGDTPLMKASEKGCNHIVKLILNWRDELGAGVDLNARNEHGQTALIMAATMASVDVVDTLLEHGCLDEFQDHRGFYALHAVIHGVDYQHAYARSDFLALIGALASEETHVDRYGEHSSFGKAMHIDWTRNDEIQKIVRMLVTRGRADINSKDFRGNTVLDLALKSKHRISQKTVELLKEYGATSFAVLNNQAQYPKNSFQYTDTLGKTPLHRLLAVLQEYRPRINLREKFDFFRNCLNSNPHKEAFEEMTVAKDIRGRTALHYAVITTDMKSYSTTMKTEYIFSLINDLKLKFNINEKDKNGRTPLHYCENDAIFESLVEQGANEDIQDNDGKTPRDLKKLRDEELKKYYLRGELEAQINQAKIDAWNIWKDGEYAHRDQLSENICDKIRQFMTKLSEEIGTREPKFECRPVLTGSAKDGTKIGLPDEFDFSFILTKLSELCEVVPSPVAPSGFVHLKRKSYNAEYFPENHHGKCQQEFDRFFKDGFLLTTEIASRFRILYLQVLSKSEFWKGDDFFEWHPCSEVVLEYYKREKQFDSLGISTDPFPSNHLCSTIQLKLNRPIEGRYMFSPISIDIVPCIKINGWWPDEALSSLSDEMKCEGCHLVFDQPQRNYPWVPFSDPFARISFAPAEGLIIKECSAVARAAYMVGKRLLHVHDETQFTYVLKNCLLYCIEALKDCTNNSLLYGDINPTELRFFVEKLMLCFHEFCLQDFLPCYMMPSFHLQIERYLKSNAVNDSRWHSPFFYYKLYRKVCTTKSVVDFCPPVPEPLNEKFKRKVLMRKLSMERTRRVHSWPLATGEIFRFDSESRSPNLLDWLKTEKVT